MVGFTVSIDAERP